MSVFVDISIPVHLSRLNAVDYRHIPVGLKKSGSQRYRGVLQNLCLS